MRNSDTRITLRLPAHFRRSLEWMMRELDLFTINDVVLFAVKNALRNVSNNELSVADFKKLSDIEEDLDNAVE